MTTELSEDKSNANKVVTKLFQTWTKLAKSAKIGFDFEMHSDSSSDIIKTVFEIDDILTLAYFDFMLMLKYDKHLKICQNCCTVFLPENRADQKYCNRIIDSSGKTCRSIGPHKKERDKLLNNRLDYAYKNAHRLIKAAIKNMPEISENNRNKKKEKNEKLIEWEKKAKSILSNIEKADNDQKGCMVDGYCYWIEESRQSFIRKPRKKLRYELNDHNRHYVDMFRNWKIQD